MARHPVEFRGTFGATPRGDGAREVEGLVRALDLSRLPTDNSDRAAKLGDFQQTLFAVIVEREEESGAYRTADGQRVEGSRLSHWPIEPDVLNLRFHGKVKRKPPTDSAPKLDAPGDGDEAPVDEVEDSVYDFGLVADHQNENWKKETRSTIIKDQSTRQRWGLVSEILTLTDVNADLSDEEMMLTSAGFPYLLHPKKLGGRSVQRNGVAVHISRNAGQVADREKVGSFNHVFCWLGTGESGGPSQGGAGRSGSTAGPVPATEDELGIRGDAGIRLKGGQIVVLEHNEPPALELADGLYFQVLTYGDLPGPASFPGLDLGLDRKSNSKKIEKKVPKRPLKGFVQLKKYYERSKHPH
jgi:hypothetical protein